MADCEKRPARRWLAYRRKPSPCRGHWSAGGLAAGLLCSAAAPALFVAPR